MLRINPQPLASDDDLRAALQNAIRLEHSTIPPYLTALATLKGNTDSVKYARKVIREIVVNEMLHMTLACNILNAIGGHPVIADANFVPKYPHELPMGIAGDLVVHLRRYSKALVENTFMKIEEPEIILDIPTMPTVLEAVAEPITIGQFYAGISARIAGHPELFTGDPELQVSNQFQGEVIVTDVDSALLAIETIKEQGEGTPKSPLDLQNDVAHYYAFQQFSKGMRIVKNAASPVKVSFDLAQPITIDDTADVIQMVDDPPTVTYDPADARAEQLSVEADASYSNILRALHRGFNGDPSKSVDEAVDAMTGEFKSIVRDLLQQQLTAGPLAGQFAGPRFRYVV
jgi:hypothetical protein